MWVFLAPILKMKKTEVQKGLMAAEPGLVLSLP